jgi:hypothetical protein
MNNENRAEYLREYYRNYRELHKEEIAARASKYRERPEVKERKKEYSREYNKNHREEARIRGRRYYAENRKLIRDRSRKKQYGISPEEYLAMLVKQGGVCFICGTDNWGKRMATIDHDHSTGVIRGLLCFRCNVALGLVDDDINVLSKMIDYLKGGLA